MKSAFPTLTAVNAFTLASLALLVSLSAFTPVYAITSTVVAGEEPTNGLSDTINEGAGLEPEYAGLVVDGILSFPANEQSAVVVTQEAPAPAPEQVIVKYYPAPAPETNTQESEPEQEVQAVPDESAESLNGVQSQQVLGVSTERDKLTAYYGDLRKSMDMMANTHDSMNDFLLAAMLVMAAVIPLQVFILVIQFRMEESLLAKKTRRRNR